MRRGPISSIQVHHAKKPLASLKTLHQLDMNDLAKAAIQNASGWQKRHHQSDPGPMDISTRRSVLVSVACRQASAVTTLWHHAGRLTGLPACSDPEGV